MTCVALVFSLCVSGALASLIDVETGSSKMDSPDYHLIPSAGDVFGA